MLCVVLGLGRRNLARASLVQRRERAVWLERRRTSSALPTAPLLSSHSPATAQPQRRPGAGAGADAASDSANERLSMPRQLIFSPAYVRVRPAVLRQGRSSRQP